MNAKFAFSLVVAFLLGAVAHFVATEFILVNDAEIDVERHWQLVDEYQKLIGDPKNYEPHANGLAGVTIEYDPETSYVALAAAGELEFVDMVLPNVPQNRETELHWMNFVSEHKDAIIYAIGNPEYTDYRFAGSPPIHLKLWFRESAKPTVKQLIQELEQLAQSTGG